MNNFSFEESLREERQRLWTGYALAAKTNSESAQKICQGWSESADLLLQKAFEFCFGDLQVALFALGKLGSGELNLSSDVDILLVAQDEAAVSLPSLRKFQKVLADRTPQGFVFRVDFDLRPGGTQGPLIPTADQFNDYYGNYGETWERLALVRLRALAGNASVINSVLSFAKKFSFQKHLDFTLLEDLKGLRSKIQGHYWTRSQEQVIDLKLGIGGIRDVELFTHALQVLHGGRDAALQVRGTAQALGLIEARKLLPKADADFLIGHYWNLRRLENYVQSLNDEQTHLLPLRESHPMFIVDSLKTLREEMDRCDMIVKTLLGEAPQDIPLEDDLRQVGLNDDDLKEIWTEILEQQVLSRAKTRDETARKAFLYAFFAALKEQNGDVRRGLLLLKDFIHGTRAKATFFSLLLRESALLKKLAWLFGHSPYLSRILCNRPELLDSFVYRAQDKHSEDLAILLEELAERRLLSEIINGSEFLENRELHPLLENLSSTADSIVSNLTSALKKEYPSQIRILALGKWGGHELGFRSDLDFIFVVDNEPTDTDFKFAKRFITRLTESHRGGNIYSIDMRLRPSGKAGPLVIEEKDLMSYLQKEASGWERQAYLKARWTGAEDAVRPVLWFINRGLSADELQELDRIRMQLISTPLGVLNLKYSEGGLIDIELAAQAYILEKKIIPNFSSTRDFFSICWGASAEILQHNYNRLRQVEQMQQLVASETTPELHINHELFQSLAKALQSTPEQLHQEVSQLLACNITLLKKLDPRRYPH